MTDILMGIDPEEKEDICEKANEETEKRKPFALWRVEGVDYRLKLTASAICEVEKRIKGNLLMMLADQGLPPLSTMLTIIQCAMLKYHHGMTYYKVQEVYDAYVEEGGDQSKLLSEVIMPIMAVSGFFTQAQQEEMEASMKNLDSLA